MRQRKETAKDWTGIKRYQLTFIRRTDKKDGSNYIWEALCDCGNTTYTAPSRHIHSCGCAHDKARKDWTNIKINRLLFISACGRVKAKDGYKIIWQAQCDCGNIIEVLPYNVSSGHTKSCGCYKVEASSNNTYSRKHDPVISSALDVWRTRYSDGYISFEEFFDLSQKDCFYCGKPPSNTTNISNRRAGYSKFQIENGNFTYNGLDRIDSSLPHNVENCVPACKRCNWAKSDLTLDAFISHIERIYEHTRRLRQSPTSTDTELSISVDVENSPTVER